MPEKTHPAFDVTIIQKGEDYYVSGRDARALYNKMMSLPKDLQTLWLSPIRDGKFVMRKKPLADSATNVAASA